MNVPSTKHKRQDREILATHAHIGILARTPRTTDKELERHSLGDPHDPRYSPIPTLEDSHDGSVREPKRRTPGVIARFPTPSTQ